MEEQEHKRSFSYGGRKFWYLLVHVAVQKSWNGSSWTEVNDLNTAKNYWCRMEEQTAAFLQVDMEITAL